MSNTSSGLSPTAAGSFEKTPFVHLLVYMADRQLTGSIVLASPRGKEGEEHAIYFVDGTASKFRTGEPVAHLGRVLFELGSIDEQQLHESLLALSDGAELQGEWLIRQGLIDRPVLLAGLQAQAVRKMAYLVSLPSDTMYAFYQDVNLLEDWGGAEITALDPLPAIWSGICARANEPVIEATLARLGNTPLKLHDKSDVARFGFQAHERAVVDLIRARASSLAELIATEVMPESSIKLIVYTLLITRHLDHGASAASPIGVQLMSDTARLRAMPGVAVARVKLTARRPDAEVAETRKSSSSAPPPLSPDHIARRESILKRSAIIDREDYFAMLGVDRKATDGEIQAAYYALAKAWHPDRMPPELASIREHASKVFARMSEAFENLSDDARKQRYLGVLRGGGGTPEESDQIQEIIDVATDFQRAEILWKRRDPGAEKLIVRAYSADPEQSDYIALYATLELSKRLPDAAVDDLLKLCDRAIASNERCERAFFCRGTLRKRIGKVDLANADFRAAYELNPKNIDAAREVRLYEMRRLKQGDRRSTTPAPRRSTPPGAGKASNKSSPPARSAPPGKKASGPPTKKDGGVLSGLGKLFKR